MVIDYIDKLLLFSPDLYEMKKKKKKVADCYKIKD